MRIEGERATGGHLETLRAGTGGYDEARVAVLTAAGLYIVGAALTGTAALLPHVSSPGGVIAVAATAVLTAGALILAAARRRASLTLACLADLWGVLLVALLCAATGAARSPFALIYFFAIGHAAAFQPRARLVLVSVAGVVAFATPLLYSHVSAIFGALACVGLVLALLTNGVVHLALSRAREQHRLLEFLIAATSNLDSSLDPAETLRHIAGTAVPELAALCVIDPLDTDGATGSAVAAAADPQLAADVERMREQDPPRSDGVGVFARALASGSPVIVEDSPGAPESDRDRDHRSLMAATGYPSAAVLPMIARGRTHGTISFLNPRRRGRYDSGQLAVLEDLTRRAAMAYDNARLYAERARVARTLRRSLMPAELPTVAGFELASFFRPMGAGDEVGGDFFDVLADEEGCWLIVGDVCGKGAEAAALTGFLRHTAMAYTREGESPADVLARVNQAMLEQDFEDRFATSLLARVRLVDGGAELELAAAGHPPALLVRSGGAVQQIGRSGTLLGVFADPQIADVRELLGTGDVLTLYTDGLADAHAPRRTISAEEMIGALESSRPSDSREAIATLLRLLDLERGARDDIAILAAQVRAEARPQEARISGSAGMPAPARDGRAARSAGRGLRAGR